MAPARNCPLRLHWKRNSAASAGDNPPTPSSTLVPASTAPAGVCTNAICAAGGNIGTTVTAGVSAWERATRPLTAEDSPLLTRTW